MSRFETDCTCFECPNNFRCTDFMDPYNKNGACLQAAKLDHELALHDVEFEIMLSEEY